MINNNTLLNGGNFFGTPLLIGSGNSQNVHFITDGVQRMTIMNGASNGNVGIGTTSPVKKLHVQALVIWTNSAGCGIKFQPVNNRDVQIVDDLIYFVETSRTGKKSVLDKIFKKVS